MFSIRTKQLQRHLLNYIDSIGVLQHQEFAKSLYGFCFVGVLEGTQGDKESFIDSLYNSLSSEESLAKTISRTVSRLATEEPSDHTLHQLFGIVVFLHYLFSEFSTEDESRQDQELVFDKKAFHEFEQILKTVDKPKNNQIKNVAGMIEFFIDKAALEIDRIQKINGWADLVNFVFGVQTLQPKESPQDLNRDNIKAMLMELGWQGELVEQLYTKYQGLLTFSMSMLTALTGSDLEIEFKDKINAILTQMGSSSQQIIFQKKLRNQYREYETILDNLEEIAPKLIQNIENYQLDLSPHLVVEFFKTITKFPHINREFESVPQAKNLPGFQEIFGVAKFRNEKQAFLNTWDRYQQLIQNIHSGLSKINEFFDSLIRQSNSIISTLLARSFKTSVPLRDIKQMEEAQINIRTIASSKNGSSVQIPQKVISNKNKLYHQFDAYWQKLQGFLEKKVKEEEVISSIPDRLRIFKHLKSELSRLVEEFGTNRLFSGYKEETPFVIATLQSLNPIMNQMCDLIDSMKNLPYNKNNIPKFMNTIEGLSSRLNTFEDISYTSMRLNGITKFLYQIQPEKVYNIASNPAYIREPQKLRDLISELPIVIKRKYQQKMISQEEKERLDQAQKRLVHLVEDYAQYKGVSSETLANRIENES